MQIQINTGPTIEGTEQLADHVRSVVAATLERFSDKITRVEVHLTDENGHAAGPGDTRCLLEVRLEGRQPTVVTHHAATVHQAVDGAARKLERAVESILGRLRDSRMADSR